MASPPPPPPAAAAPALAAPVDNGEAETIFKVMSNQVRDSQLYTA